MTLTEAGVLFVVLYAVWHLNLALRSMREVAGVLATRSVAESETTPRALWLVLLNPTPPVLSAVRRLDTVPDLNLHVLAIVDDCDTLVGDEPDGLLVAPDMDRATRLNAAYRYIRDHTTRTGGSRSRTVVGVLGEGACPSRNLVSDVSARFADRLVGAVQTRIRSSFRGPFSTAQQYEGSVLLNAAQILRGSRDAALLGVNGGFVRLSILDALADNPWPAGAAEGLHVGQKLNEAGVAVRYTSVSSVAVGALRVGGLVRQRARWAQGHLQAWPEHGRGRTAVFRWFLHLATWVLPALGVVAVLGAFGTAAGLLVSGQPASYAPTWVDLGRAALTWMAGVAAPTLIWWVARRNEPSGLLWRGVVSYPLLMLLRLPSLGLAVGRHLAGRRTWSSAARRSVRTAVVLEADKPSQTRDVAQPVFVDASGRRRRRTRTLAYGTALLGVAYVMFFGLSLMSGPMHPHTDVAAALYAGGQNQAAPIVVLPADAPTPRPTPTPTPGVGLAAPAPVVPVDDSDEVEPDETEADPEDPEESPSPSTPAPSTPAPSPAPSTPAPSTPAPTEPTPTEPAPTDPAPTDPAPTDTPADDPDASPVAPTQTGV